MVSVTGTRKIGSRGTSQGTSQVRLTRTEVAKRLGVSTSTVRRYEGGRLHPVKDAAGAWTFDPAEVAALAAELVSDPAHTPGARGVPQEAPPELPRGELAARVFERLEQRQTLAEIVIGLRVAPELVRALYHEWLVGLTEGELQQQPEPALPTDDERRARERHVSPEDLGRLLADLPMGMRTRISLARDMGEFGLPPVAGGSDWPREARNVIELGGFLVLGPIELGEIARRYGRGSYRITAYGAEPPGVRWEVFTEIERAHEAAALAAVEPPASLPAPTRATLPAPATIDAHDEAPIAGDDANDDEHDERDTREPRRPFDRLRTELAAASVTAPAAATSPATTVVVESMADALAKHHPALLALEPDDAPAGVRELGARVRAVLGQMPALSDAAARAFLTRLSSGEVVAAVTAQLQAADPDAIGGMLSTLRVLLSPIEWDGFELLGERAALMTRLIAAELARDIEPALARELVRGQLAMSLVTRLAEAKGLAAPSSA
jgi:transcriptional regulator with XRE-family HTH domain